MGLESSTYIGGLVATNPVSTDPKAEGDDHLRLIKSAAKNTFPNATKVFRFPDSTGKTANYSILASDDNLTIITDTTVPFNLTLPTLALDDRGWHVDVVKASADLNALTIVGIINAAVNYTITRQFVGARFFWTGGIWLGFAFTSATIPHITTAQIVDDAVTYAKIQNVAASRILGRGSLLGPGDAEELIVGAGLALTGTTLTVAAFVPPTMQDFLSGTGVIYNTPVGVKWIRVRAVAGGGGSQQSGTAATSGADTIFDSIVASGGLEGGVAVGNTFVPGVGGLGGSGGAGAAGLRIQGGQGGRGSMAFTNPNPENVGALMLGGYGGASMLSGGPTPQGTAGPNNSGAGAGGPQSTSTGGAGSENSAADAGGGGGEYFELIRPAGSYSLTVGAGGSAGTGGFAGGSGRVIVEEYYQ